MKIIFFLAAGAAAGGAFSANLGEAPMDEAHESRLHSIYKKYYSRPISPERWQELTQGRDFYPIKKQDNLWNISRRLFGSSYYWPKLWAENQDISNPHRVSENQMLKMMGGFDLPASGPYASPSLPMAGAEDFGDQALAPTAGAAASSVQNCTQVYSNLRVGGGPIRVYDSKIKCLSNKQKIRERRIKDRAEINQYFANNQDVNLPPARAVRALKSPPPSLPHSILIKKVSSDLNLNVSYQTQSEDHLNYYLVDKDSVKTVGSVIEILDGWALVTSEIMLNLDVPADAGSLFTLVSPLKKIRPSSRHIKGPFGYEFKVQAVVEVTEPVPNQSGMYFARVKKMNGFLTKEALIIEGPAAAFDLEKSARQAGSGQAQIVGSPEGHSSQMINLSSFVYLNRGQEGAINVGDVLNIEGSPRNHGKKPVRPLGQMVVVHSSPFFATAFVEKLSAPAFIGDEAAPSSGGFADEALDDVYTEEEPFDDDEGEALLEEDPPDLSESGEEEGGLDEIPPEEDLLEEDDGAITEDENSSFFDEGEEDLLEEEEE